MFLCFAGLTVRGRGRTGECTTSLSPDICNPRRLSAAGVATPRTQDRKERRRRGGNEFDERRRGCEDRGDWETPTDRKWERERERERKILQARERVSEGGDWESGLVTTIDRQLRLQQTYNPDSRIIRQQSDDDDSRRTPGCLCHRVHGCNASSAAVVVLQKRSISGRERDKCFTSKRDNESVRMVDSSDQEEEGRSGSEGGTLADNRRRRRCIRQPDPSTGEAGDYSFYSLSLSLSLFAF